MQAPAASQAALTGVGHGDIVDFVGIKPDLMASNASECCSEAGERETYLAKAAAHHRGGQSLGKLQ